MSELKPCPFCGEHNLWTYRSNFAPEEYRYVKCAKDPQEDDGCVSGVAVEMWNTRPIEDQLRSENERMKEALNKIIAYYKDDEFSPHDLIKVNNIARQALNEVTK